MKIRCYAGLTRPSFSVASPELPFSLHRRQRLSVFAGLNCSCSKYTLKSKLGLVAMLQYSSAAKRTSSSRYNRSDGDKHIPHLDRKREPKYSSSYARSNALESRDNMAANRAMLYEFLRSIGIVPDELEGLELPVTVAVMKERLDFIHKLGLTIDDINNYPLILGCSVKKNMIPVLDYLGKLGVRKSTFTQFLRRYPQVLHASVVVDLDPVVRYLKGMDIKAQDIPGVLERYPELFGFKLEGTMSTSVAYLVGIGVSRREIGSVLTRYPEVMGMRVGRMIKPLVDYLVSLGLPRLAVARLIEKRPHVLGFGLDKLVKPNIALLLDYNVRREFLGSVIAQYPEIIGLDLAEKLPSQQSLLHSVIDLSVDNFGGIVEKMPQIVSLNSAIITKHVQFLKDCGFALQQIRTMVEGCPQVLALNLDVMKLSFDYFIDEMRRPLEDLVVFPAYFTYSLESTVKPRHRRIAVKGFHCSLSWFLNCSDEKFENRMEYDPIDMEEMEMDMPSFDINTLIEHRGDDDSASDYETDDE